MAPISGIKSKRFRGIGFFPRAAQTLVCSGLSSCHPWEALLQKGPDFPTRVLNCASTSFQEQGCQFCSRIWQTTWRDLSGKFSASNLPNFSVKGSRVRLWEKFIFLQSLCLLLFPPPCPRRNTRSEKWQKYCLITPFHPSPPKPNPHSPVIPGLHFLLGVLRESLPLTKYIYFYLKVLSEHGHPLMPGGEKFLFPSEKKNWILFKIAKFRKLFAD